MQPLRIQAQACLSRLQMCRGVAASRYCVARHCLAGRQTGQGGRGFDIRKHISEILCISLFVESFLPRQEHRFRIRQGWMRRSEVVELLSLPRLQLRRSSVGAEQRSRARRTSAGVSSASLPETPGSARCCRASYVGHHQHDKQCRKFCHLGDLQS